MEISDNFFEIFRLPVSYDIDISQLSERYRTMQQQFHPDKYAGKPAREQRLAEQYAAVVNQAYNELKSPLLRAQYLLSLHGVDGANETAITRDPDFLMEQMTLREALSEVRDANDSHASLAEINEHAIGEYRSLQKLFSECLGAADMDHAAEAVAKMQFFSKLISEIHELEHELDEE